MPITTPTPTRKPTPAPRGKPQIRDVIWFLSPRTNHTTPEPVLKLNKPATIDTYEKKHLYSWDQDINDISMQHYLA